MTTQNSNSAECQFCAGLGEDVLYRDARCRVILVTGDEGASFPGFCRVAANQHIREMSDLSPGDQHHLMGIVLAVERAIRAVQHPDKMNIASLGNVVPHLHWHIIPRWEDDSHFPKPIWAEARRKAVTRHPVDRPTLIAALATAIKAGGIHNEI